MTVEVASNAESTVERIAETNALMNHAQPVSQPRASQKRSMGQGFDATPCLGGTPY